MILADAGTPLIWAGFLHLTVGNLIIGLLESWIVRWFAGKPSVRFFSSIILANYVSCTAGYFLISEYSEKLIRLIGGSLPVYSLQRIIVVLIVASFALTLLVELPFFFFALRRQKAGIRHSFYATLAANGASDLLLIGWYWLASVGPGQWGVTLVPTDQLTPIPAARIYYISPDGNDVMRCALTELRPRSYVVYHRPCPTASWDSATSLLTVHGS